jgi:predicted heme/steroid binding protein
MKKNIVLALSILLISILTVACSSKADSPDATESKAATTTEAASDTTSTTASADTTDTATTDSSSKIFTTEDLAKYDGKNGNPAYVAVNGTVYDVSNAKGWKDGVHQSGITAGNDLTKEIESSPHGDSVLANLPVVGTLE